jgi:hypothetical protein
VTIVSFAGRGDAGDDLRLRGTVHAVRELSSQAEITAVVGGPERVAAFMDSGVRLVEGPLGTLARIKAPSGMSLLGRRTTRSSRQVLEKALADSGPNPVRDSMEAVRSADLVVLLGGGYLNDLRPLRLLTAGMLADEARRRGVPYALFGHSVGPFEHGGALSRARELLEHAAGVTIREPRSSWELAALLKARHAEPMGDPALLDPRPEPPAESLPLMLLHFPGVKALAEYRKTPIDPALTLADGVYMAARQLRAEVSYVEANTPPASDDRAGNTVLDAGLLPTIIRREPVSSAGGSLDPPPAAVVISTQHDLCSWALANGIPAVGVALTPHARHELRGLMDLFQRPDWVWVPEAEFGIHDLSGRAVQAANDPNRAQIRVTADALAERQRAWLADLLR